MGELAIDIQNLGKRYELGQMQPLGVRTLNAVRRIVGRRQPADDPRELWALRDINLQVERGEVVGIVGRNGAGKSTLLKILSRITDPTEGFAELRGRVASLLEVGTGFHPELTGRENIFLNGAILGMSRREVRAKLAEIVEFSGIERFLDTPVKRYSSGMRVRLAFAVAAHLEPEILIIDEVLAVGDAEFQKRCLGKMQDVSRSGRTVLFVSHNMAAVSALCHRAALLHTGQMQRVGAVDEVVRLYQDRMSSSARMPLVDRKDREGNGRIRFTDVRVVAADNGNAIRCGGAVAFELYYATPDQRPTRHLKVAVSIADDQGRLLFTCASQHRHISYDDVPAQGRIVCHVPRLPLVPGDYVVHVAGLVQGERADLVEHALPLIVNPFAVDGAARLPQREKHGPMIVTHRWDDRIEPTISFPIHRHEAATSAEPEHAWRQAS